MEAKYRFWFYSGRNAERRAGAKVQGVAGAKVLDRKEAKAQRLAIPKAKRHDNAAWEYVVVAPAELEPEAEE